MKPTKQMLYRLLSDALIDIRLRGYQSGDKAVFALSDMFHNLPSELDRLEQGELSVEDVLKHIRECAQRHDDAEGWLDHRMREIAKQHPETMADDDSAP